MHPERPSIVFVIVIGVLTIVLCKNVIGGLCEDFLYFVSQREEERS